MQIKTIWKPLDYIGMFDNTVNDALADGWRLTKREILPSNLLYAELVKVDPLPETAAIDPLEAVQVLARACEAAPHCEPGSCPLHDWCTGLSTDSVPKDWKRSAENE